MKRLLVLIAALLIWSPAFAATIYYCDNQAGSHANVVPGNNVNAGTDPAAPKRTFPSEATQNAMAVGDIARFCRDGAWVSTSVLIGISKVTRDPDVIAWGDFTFESYTSSEFTGAGARPLLHNTGSVPVVSFGGFGDNDVCSLPSTGHCDGGYTLRGLELRGAGVANGQPCVWMRSNVIKVLMEDVDIRQCETGIKPGGSLAWTPPGTAPCSTTGACDTRWITIQDSIIRENCDHGILGSSTDFIVQRTTIRNNNSNSSGNCGTGEHAAGGGGEHGIYLASHGVKRVVIRDNWFDRNSLISGVCRGGNFTMHGSVDGLLLENNLFEQDSSGTDCYGISLTAGYNSPEEESLLNAVVRGNRMVNYLKAMCVNIAPGIVIENNVIVDATTGMELGSCSGGPWDAGFDEVMTDYRVVNNSFYYSSGFSGGTALALANSNSTTSGVVVANNLVVFAGSTGTRTCFAYDTTSASYTVRDDNLCFGFTRWQDATTDTLAEAIAAGYDTNSLESNPSVTVPTSANGYSMALPVGSSALAVGNTTHKARLSFQGWARPAAPSIGAYDGNNP